MPIARNETELLAMMSKDFLKIVEETSQYTLDQTEKEIELTVYNSFPESPWYKRLERHGGYLGSWVQDTVLTAPDEIEGSVQSDPSLMVLDEQNYIHGSSFFGDQRSEMTENIVTGKNYDWGGNASISRDFWSDVETMVTNGSLDAVFENGMRKRNINFIKI
jgi:hypothetical protein